MFGLVRFGLTQLCGNADAKMISTGKYKSLISVQVRWFAFHFVSLFLCGPCDFIAKYHAKCRIVD